MASSVAFTVLLLVASGVAEAAGAELTKNRPVSKVITLLKDVLHELDKEAEEDQKTMDAFGCWCEVGLKGKTTAIADAQQKIGQLTSSIEDLASNSARLSTEIETLNKEIAENTEALESATAMRKKELAEFTSEEQSAMGSISQMKGAVATLSKHQGAAFLQQTTSDRETAVARAVAAMRSQLQRHQNLVPAAQRAVVAKFLATPFDFVGSDSLSLLQYTHNPGYAPQSGQIFGVLKSMQESFETNLAADQKEETQNQADYEGLKKAKDSEIAAGTSLADTKTQERASTDEKHAEDEQSLKDTEATLAADQEYLKNLKEQCANIDAEFAERTKTRQLEIKAVSEALEYINSDDAQDLFSRTFSFFQTSSQTHGSSARRSASARLLTAAAVRHHDPRLSVLATRVMAPQDAFDQVKVSIQDMIDKLVAEKEDEIKHKDFCVDSIQQNEKDTDVKLRIKNDNQAFIDTLAAEIKQLAEEIAALQAEIAASRVSLKRAGEDRERANKEFQLTVADQRATQALLKGSLDILKSFYEKAALLQAKQATARQGAPAGPPPPQGFKKTSMKSGGVMGMMQQIIDDAKAMEEEALKGETDSQVAYESFVLDANAAVVDMQKQITHKTEAKSQAEADKAQKEVELSNVVGELAELKTASEDLHADCDYTLRNFDARQGARDDEIHALKESIAIFSGASFGAFVQTLH